MCKAKEYSEQLLNIYSKIEEEHQTLIDQLRQVDLYEQDVLHIIEDGKFSASKGYEYAKMIYENRQKRRQIKNELDPLRELKGNFVCKNSQLLNNVYQTIIKKDNLLTHLTENKVYTPRVIGKEKVVNIQDSITISQQIIPDENYRLLHKKTGREIEIIQKVDDNLYLVRFKNSKQRNVLNKKNIINLDKLITKLA